MNQSNNEKIPKIIHYIWFGGNPLPELAQKCIESWKKYCPDYKIIRWDESNFDLKCNTYVLEAYKAKKWAFVSDVARLYVLVNYGGIYMDTDVEVIRSLDNLLDYEALSGFESESRISTGLMACQKGNAFFRELLADYEIRHFIKGDGSMDLTTNVEYITNSALKYGFQPNNHKQTVNGFTLLPREYLCPKNFDTGEIELTQNTYCIHHFDGSWHTAEEKYQIDLYRKYGKILSNGTAINLARFMTLAKYHGVNYAVKKLVRWARR